MKRALPVFVFSLAATLVAMAAAAQSGPNLGVEPQLKAVIKGVVTDAATGERLIGTTILVEGTSLATASDVNGEFTISNITPGAVSVIATYLGYEIFRRDVVVRGGEEITIEVALKAEGVNLQEIVVTAQIDNESENVILSQQREALVALQTVGASEMSRKGIGDARGAVAQLSGVSQQEGVKNVFVRGLGDRYNATYLNGFPLPSEDPEYKNIALEFFGSDIIRSIGVNKVLSASTGGDVGGAVIDIRSKELIGREEFSVSLDGGVNTSAVGADNFLKADGVNYFGASRSRRPTLASYDFPNSLDPTKVKLPLNHSYGISGGRRWSFGEDGRNQLSFFAVGSHETGYSFTEETVRGAASNGGIYQDQVGEKSSIEIRQLALANVALDIDRRYEISYNFLLVHAGDEYVGDYSGIEIRRYADAIDQQTGFTRRQQSNDNLLITNQLSTRWTLGERWDFTAGAAYNSVRGLEPDRRENNLSLGANGTYFLTGSNNQRRFFSELRESDINLRAALRWKLDRDADIDKSNITLGYRGRVLKDDFWAVNYDFNSWFDHGFSLADLSFDEVYNEANYSQERADGKFVVRAGEDNVYNVSKRVHSGYVDLTHEFSPKWSIGAGLLVENVDMEIDYDVDTVPPGTEQIEKLYTLPNLSLRFDPAERHSIRLGLSQSYTLPQSKEIAPYQYINISYASEGNPNLKPSDNYNLDLKWDWYLSSSEIISLGGFYKYIANPIGRVDLGNSASLLTYDNISPRADVAGIEMEMRKNILNTTTARQNMRRLSLGVNASYIYSDLELDIVNTAKRRTELEGASPFLVNADLSYNYSSGRRVLNVSLVANWFSDRIHTLGSRGYNDLVEESALNLSAVASMRMNDNWTLKFKAGNITNPAFRLTREYTGVGRMVINEYRRGVDVSVGVSFEL